MNILKGRNKEEFALGAVFGATALVVNPVLALVNSLSAAFLWSQSGMPKQDKFWRRFVLPGVDQLTKNIPLLWPLTWLDLGLIAISYSITAATLSMGYGIPTRNDPGSWLGKQVFKFITTNEFLATMVTRGIICSLLALGMFPIAIAIDWVIYLVLAIAYVCASLLTITLVEGMFE